MRTADSKDSMHARGRPHRRPWAAAGALLLCALLAGCADYDAYRKCGKEGCPGDAQITAAVQASLKQHPALQPPNVIYVRTVDHTVYLTGQVATGLQRDTAESLAKQTPEVHRVVNSIALGYQGR
jgi:osmotically-inducible protein OsmY